MRGAVLEGFGWGDLQMKNINVHIWFATEKYQTGDNINLSVRQFYLEVIFDTYSVHEMLEVVKIV